MPGCRRTFGFALWRDLEQAGLIPVPLEFLFDAGVHIGEPFDRTS